MRFLIVTAILAVLSVPLSAARYSGSLFGGGGGDLNFVETPAEAPADGPSIAVTNTPGVIPDSRAPEALTPTNITPIIEEQPVITNIPVVPEVVTVPPVIENTNTVPLFIPDSVPETAPVVPLKPGVPKVEAWQNYPAVQAGAFTNPGNAERMVSRLRALGYNAYITEVRLNGRLYQRVRIAAASWYDASVMAEDLRRYDIKCFVVR